MSNAASQDRRQAILEKHKNRAKDQVRQKGDTAQQGGDRAEQRSARQALRSSAREAGADSRRARVATQYSS